MRLSDTARYCVILSAFAGYFVVRIVVRKSRPQQGFSGGSPAEVPVDIPDSWDPRTKQQPTGLIACRLRAAVLFDPSSPQDKK